MLEGYSPETSGGLLIVMDSKNAEAFIQNMEAKHLKQCWVVGRVFKDEKESGMAEQV